MNEAEARAERIAPPIKAAGWDVVEGSRVCLLHVFPVGGLKVMH